MRKKCAWALNQKPGICCTFMPMKFSTLVIMRRHFLPLSLPFYFCIHVCRWKLNFNILWMWLSSLHWKKWRKKPLFCCSHVLFSFSIKSELVIWNCSSISFHLETCHKIIGFKIFLYVSIRFDVAWQWYIITIFRQKCSKFHSKSFSSWFQDCEYLRRNKTQI